MSKVFSRVFPIFNFEMLVTVLTCASQAPHSATFVALLGTDTVRVETYNMINNHLYGKAFIRVPEDYVGEFDIHFYPDSSIRTFKISAMHPFNNSVPFPGQSKGFSYYHNML